MMSRVVLATAMHVIAEECASDDAMLMQTKAARNGGKSQVARLTEAIEQTEANAQFICLSAEVGESAPFAGTFTPVSGAPFAGTFTPVSGAKVDVEAGYVAQEA